MNKAINIISKISAVVFHPLFLFFYGFLFLLFLKPHWFGVHHIKEQHLLIVLVFIYTCFIPIVGIAVLKFIGLIKSFEMHEKHERIAPMMICLIFYLWLWVNLKNQDTVPKVLIAFVLTSIISISISFVINNWIKISLHAVGISAFLMLWIKVRISHSSDGIFNFRFFEDSVSSFHIHHLIIISIVLAGWIGSSRLLLGVHNKHDVYIGYIVGIFSTLIAFSITF